MTGSISWNRLTQTILPIVGFLSVFIAIIYTPSNYELYDNNDSEYELKLEPERGVDTKTSSSNGENSVITGGVINGDSSNNKSWTELLEQLPQCIKEDKFCRYDDVGDFFENDHPAMIHDPLPSIPLKRRIPHEKANDWPYVLQRRAQLPEDGSQTALMDYNTMIIPLYKNVNHTSDGSSSSASSLTLEPAIDPVLLDQLSGKYHPHFTNDETDRVKYLEVTRSSNLHSCKPKFKFHFGTLPQDFLGLSLLDENLSRIQGTDVSINMDKVLMGNMTADFYDFQLVAAKVTKDATYKNQFFLFPSGHLGTFLFPIDLRRVPPMKDRLKYENITWDAPHIQGADIHIPNAYTKEEYMYGDGIEVRIHAHTEGLDKRKSHSRGDLLFNRGHGLNRGKNFHFFEANDGQTYMETWPHGTHRVIPVNFLNMTHFVQGVFPGMIKVQKKGKRYQIEFTNEIESKDKEPVWSFKTVTPKHERPKKRFRGTSQIIDIVLNGNDVKVGISHTGKLLEVLIQFQ